MNVLIYIIGILLSYFIGVASVIGYQYLQSNSTEIWKSKSTLVSDNGIIIPSGTEFTVNGYYSEGFVALNLSINIEGSELTKFQKNTRMKRNYRVPYFVYENEDSTTMD